MPRIGVTALVYPVSPIADIFCGARVMRAPSSAQSNSTAVQRRCRGARLAASEDEAPGWRPARAFVTDESRGRAAGLLKSQHTHAYK